MAGSGSHSLDHLSRVYESVMNDVIRNVKEEFLNDGVDPEVLEDLRQIWLNKLNQSGVVGRPTPAEPPPKAASSEPKTSSRQHLQISTSKPPNPVHNVPPSLPPPLVPVQQIVSDHAPSQLSASRDPAPSEQRDSVTVIQRAPPRSQATPTTAMAQSTTNPQAPIMLHSSMLAAIGESGSASTSQGVPTILPQSAGLHSAFQQGMVPIQTAQGTVLVPLSHLVAFQQKAAAVNQGSKDKDVRQIDGYPPTVHVHDLTTQNAQLEGESLRMAATSTFSHSSSSITSGMSSQTHESTDCTKSLNIDFEDREVSSTGSKLLKEPLCFLEERTRKRAKNRRSMRTRRKRQFPKPGDIVEFVYDPDLNRGQGSEDRGQDSKVREFIVQLDGAHGESSSEDDSDGDDSSDDDIGGTDEQVMDDDDEPLNSEDDLNDDEEEQKDFDTNDTIVCLWEKVYRVRTKWKFQLKDGIMHLGGYDYVFMKGSGEADW